MDRSSESRGSGKSGQHEQHVRTCCTFGNAARIGNYVGIQATLEVDNAIRRDRAWVAARRKYRVSGDARDSCEIDHIRSAETLNDIMCGGSAIVWRQVLEGVVTGTAAQSVSSAATNNDVIARSTRHRAGAGRRIKG